MQYFIAKFQVHDLMFCGHSPLQCDFFGSDFFYQSHILCKCTELK